MKFATCYGGATVEVIQLMQESDIDKKTIFEKERHAGALTTKGARYVMVIFVTAAAAADLTRNNGVVERTSTSSIVSSMPRFEVCARAKSAARELSDPRKKARFHRIALRAVPEDGPKDVMLGLILILLLSIWVYGLQTAICFGKLATRYHLCEAPMVATRQWVMVKTGMGRTEYKTMRETFILFVTR
jgi:hypothetical protein